MIGFLRRWARAAVLFAAIYATFTTGVATAASPGIAGTGLNDWEFFETPVSATSVRLCWGGEQRSPYDSWYVRYTAGTTPPAADAPPNATVPGDADGACYTATGLVTDEPYTFRITGHSSSGESGPAFHTLAARIPGTFLLDGSSRERLPWDTYSMQLAVTGQDRRWHAIFPFAAKTEHGAFEWTFYSTREKSGWTQPQLVAGSLNSVLAANASTVAVAWSDELRRYRPRYRLKTSGESSFSSLRTVPHARKGDNYEGSVLDRRGHLHVLSYSRRTDGSALYRSNASGKWRAQVIPTAWGCTVPLAFPCPEAPMLAYDAVTDRIVVLSQGMGRVRMASKRASAARFGALHAIAAVNKRHLSATSLTSHADRITLGLASQPGEYLSSRGVGPFYVWTKGQLVRVPSTTADDEGLLVAASSRDLVKLAWERHSTTWDRRQQGIWTADSARNKKTGRWSIRNIRHRTASHYDEIIETGPLAVSAAGRALIAFRRNGRLDTP
ncbi:MAG: hypothetical protein QOE38_277 [Thermoleophilaceae bacterium]|nr:hypothetical protein [Thermoleophilaceae bacterium]